MAVPTLKYFAFPGRGLPPRVALFAAFGKDGWKDEHIAYEDFKGNKADTAIYPLGQMPVLVLPSGESVTQNGPIARWAAKQGGLYPDDALGGLAVEEVMDVVNDVLAKTPQDKDPETKKRMREEYAAKGGFLHTTMSFLERKVVAKGGPFLLGPQLTVADISVHMLVKMIADGDFDHVPAAYVDGFPAVKAAGAAVAGSALLRSYREQYAM